MKQHIEIITNTMSRSARNTLVQITQNVQNNKNTLPYHFQSTMVHSYIGTLEIQIWWNTIFYHIKISWYKQNHK